MTNELESLAQDGVLRAAINTGNHGLVQQRDGALHGVSPALARRLAEEIGARLEPVVYDGAGKVFADARRDAWDVAFLAIDRSRGEVVAFTRPYVSIEATYAVRADSPFAEVTEADHEGVTVLVSRGSAYDMFLAETLQNASMEHAASPGESFDDFRSGRGDLVAGVRETLEQAFGGDPAFRVLPGAFRKVEQAMVLPDRADARIGALDDFVARAIADDFTVEHFRDAKQ